MNCIWTRMTNDGKGGVKAIDCRLEEGHEGEHDYPGPEDYVDAEGNPAQHPDCSWDPVTWRRSGKAWGILGAVIICNTHQQPSPCLGHPDFDAYELEDRKWSPRT